MRRIVVLFLLTAFCLGVARSEEKKEEKKSNTKKDVGKEKPKGRSYLHNPEFAPYGIYSYLAYKNKAHGSGGHYGPPKHGAYGQSFAHHGAYGSGHKSYPQYGGGSYGGSSSHHASYASPQKGVYGQGHHGGYGSPQKGAYGQNQHGGHDKKHLGSPPYGGTQKDGKGHLAYTKKKINSHLDKLHKLGNRRLEVQVDYGNTPLEYSYLQQYHNIPNPLSGTPFAKSYRLGANGGIYGTGYTMQSGYGHQGRYAHGNMINNYVPSHPAPSSAYGGQNSYSADGYQSQSQQTKAYGQSQGAGYDAQSSSYGQAQGAAYGAQSSSYGQSQGAAYGAQGSSYGQSQGAAYGAQGSSYGQSQGAAYAAQGSSYGQSQGAAYAAQGSSYGQTEGYAQTQSAAYGQSQAVGYDQSQSASYGQTNPGTYVQSEGYGQTQSASYGAVQGYDQSTPYPPLQQPYSQPHCPLHCGPYRPVDPPPPPPYSPPIYQSNVLQPPNPYSFQPQQLSNQIYDNQLQYSQPQSPVQPLYKSHQEQSQQYQGPPNSNGQASYAQPISFAQENTYESGGSSNAGDDSAYLVGPKAQSYNAAKTGSYASDNSNPSNPVTYVDDEQYQSSAPSNEYNAAGVSKRGPSLIDTFYTPL